jgi:hypothetical protein
MTHLKINVAGPYSLVKGEFFSKEKIKIFVKRRYQYIFRKVSTFFQNYNANTWVRVQQLK